MKDLKVVEDSSLPLRASEESAYLIRALERQTAAITQFAGAVMELTEALCDLVDEKTEGTEEDNPPPQRTYLNGDPLEG